MKPMKRVHQRFRDTYGNPEGTDNYKVWAEHTEYEI